MSKTTEQNAEKSKGGIIIILGAALLVGVIVFCIALVSVIKNSSGDEDTTQYSITSGVNISTSETNEDDFNGMFGNDTASDSNVGSSEQVENQQGGVGNGGVTTAGTTKNEAVAHYEEFSKNGDNILSDHHDNEFIKLVSEKYGVDTDLLVAIYGEPDTGNNFVLQFDGTKDSNGNIVKSPDTLEKVYQIDLDRNIKVATGTHSGNVGVTYAEGLFCFSMVKTLVMEQYPQYFTGIES